MKALSLTQPWAELVVLGEKQYETRSWSTRMTGLIAIHASKSFPKWAKDLTVNDPYYVTGVGKYGTGRLALGAIVGVVEIVKMHRTQDVQHNLGSKEIAFGDYGDDRWAWELLNPVKLVSPIPCRGALGLWEIPEATLAQLNVALPQPSEETT